MSVSKPAVALAAAALFLAAGCSSTGGTTTAGAPADSTPSASTQTGSAPSSAPATSSTTKASTTSGQAAGGTSRCHSSDLKITWKADPAGGAAGHQGSFLIFTNTSKSTCTLYGYPGVSFVAGDQGTQVGDAFTRTGGTKKTVSVAPGKEANATLLLVNPTVYEAADCQPVQVRGFRIYPPEETAAVFVADAQTACSAKGKGVGVVYPIVAGAPAV